jgi:glycosyltransferase involved in cell wall biosynthesis
MILAGMTGAEARQKGESHSSSIGRPLRLLAVHRYYWPDTPPYAAMLRRIVDRWYRDGHQVEVLSSQPSYKAGLDNARRDRIETVDGVRVQRLALSNEAGRPLIRLFNAARLCAALIWKALRNRYDVIMISTIPPVIGGAAAALAARMIGARFIYHCMDIHPEVGRLSGEFAHPLVFKLLSSLDNWSCHQADPVVVLSRDMENTLRKRKRGDLLKIKVLNNFSLPISEPVPETLPFELSKDKLTILFAGNIGRFQGLENVVEAMGRLKARKDIEFLMMGEGVAKAGLQKKAESMGARIRFLGHQPVEIAKATMRRVDAGFVSLVPGLYQYAYPSKTMSYLEEGCPLIVSVEPESELASDVEAEKFGHCIAVGDAQALAKLLARLADDRSWSRAMRKAAYRKSETEFAESVILDQWSRMLHRNNNSGK